MKIILLPVLLLIIIFITPKLSSVKSENENFVSPLPPVPENIQNTNNFKDNQLPIPTPTLIDQPVNILLLGLDARKGDGKPRCDAIQMISYNMRRNTINITSVPRGTIIDIPDTDPSSSYLANACHIAGIDFAIKNIERITGIHPNFIVRVGFSQTLGVLRNLGIPATPALQFLRNRSVAYGDYQRTHNQAIFIKDMIVKYLPTINSIPKPLRYILYRTIDTNMPYETANAILEKLVKSEIDRNPEKITITTKPDNNFDIKEIHFDTKKQTTSENISDADFQNYQKTISDYLQNITDRGEKYIAENNLDSAYKLVYTPFIQRLWEQVEDTGGRNDYHFRILNIFITSDTDKSQSASLVMDYITEMENGGFNDYKNRGEELLKKLGV